jgi:sugar/nucleoside kinase (ribokinase family)
MNCTILGDVNIDYISDISSVHVSELNNSCISSKINSSVGGNGIFFAEAAREVGFENINLLCSIGNDTEGERARKHCKNLNINLVCTETNLHTGRVIILYQPDDERILIADRAANLSFTLNPEDIPESIFEHTDILYISGYLLLEENQRKCICSLARDYKCKNKDAFVLIDIVPHDLFKKFSWDEYSNICNFTDGVVVEAKTLRKFWNINGYTGNWFPRVAVYYSP